MSNQKERVGVRIPSDDLFFTQFPNQLIEDAGYLSDGAYRMFTYIWMRWLRNEKNPVPISYTEFQKKLGGSTVTIKKRQDELQEAGLVSIKTGGLNVNGMDRAANVFRVVTHIELTEEEKQAVQEKADRMQLVVYDVPEEEAENPAVDDKSSGAAVEIPAEIQPLLDKNGCFPGGYVSLWHGPLTGVSTLVSTVNTGPEEAEEEKPLSHIPILSTPVSKDYRNNNTHKSNSLEDYVAPPGADLDEEEIDPFLSSQEVQEIKGKRDQDAWIQGSFKASGSKKMRSFYADVERMRKKVAEGEDLNAKDISVAFRELYPEKVDGSFYMVSARELGKIKRELTNADDTHHVYYLAVFYLDHWREYHQRWNIRDSKPSFDLLFGYGPDLTDGAMRLYLEAQARREANE